MITSRGEAIYRSMPTFRSRSSESSFVPFYSFLDYFEIKQRFRPSLEGRNNSTYVATSNGRGNRGNLSAIKRHVAAISSANDLPLSRYSCSRCSLDESRSASTSPLLRTLQAFREPFRRYASKTRLWTNDEEMEISRNEEKVRSRCFDRANNSDGWDIESLPLGIRVSSSDRCNVVLAQIPISVGQSRSNRSTSIESN